MTTTHHDRLLVLECHIWPGKSHLDGFKLGLGAALMRTRGSTSTVTTGSARVAMNQVFASDREHQLARVAIDIDDSWADRWMNPEKSSVAADADFQEAITKAMAGDGKTFWSIPR